MFDVSYLWRAIHGNSALKERLITDIYAGKLAHAYLIEGPRGSGKKMLARTIAACFAKESADVKKITTGVCPDVIELSLPDQKKSIGIDQIRSMKLSAYYQPNDLDVKFFLLEDADFLTGQAQNALLKLIEEPPRNVFIFLLCENASSLLPTIRSRAPVLRMQVFSPEELKQLLFKYTVDAKMLAAEDSETLDAILHSCGGAYGEALLRISDAEVHIGDKLYGVSEIMEAMATKDALRLCRCIYRLPPERSEFYQCIHLLRFAVRDVIAYRATRGECDYYMFPKSDRIPFFASKLSLKQLLWISDDLTAIYNEMYFNPNVSVLKAILYEKLSQSQL